MDALIFPINIFPLDITTSILKCLCYSRGNGKVEIWKFKCKIWAKSWAWQHGYIRGLVAVIWSFSLQPHFDELKMQLNVCHAPLFFSVISSICSSPSIARFLQPHFDGLKMKINIPSLGEVSSALFLWIKMKLNVCHAPSFDKPYFNRLKMKLNICHTPSKIILNCSRKFTWRLTHP